VVDSGRVQIRDHGEYFAILSPHNVLIIPCADKGKVFSSAAGINLAVNHPEEAAALW